MSRASALPPGTLASRDFARLASFIEDYSGIKMPLAKKTMVEGRLRRRLGALGMSDIADYCRYLFEENGLSEEAVHLINAITTNKTDFFREPQHFSFLIDQALPHLLAQGMIGASRPLRVWSAASSIGAEVYTIAMVLADFAERHQGLDFQILATDLCTEVLHHGLRGVYTEAEIRPVPKHLCHRYLMRAKDPSRGEVRVVPRLRSKVKFGHLNLMDETYSMPRDLDIIFCRNVLIYFDKETQERVLTRLCSHLRPGGFLFVGHTESAAGMTLPVCQVGNAVFVRNKE